MRLSGFLSSHCLVDFPLPVANTPLYLFFRYGIKPEWLQVHRVLNHRTMRDGRTLYLVKWRDLAYDSSTWEENDNQIHGLKQAVEYYMVCYLKEFLTIPLFVCCISLLIFLVWCVSGSSCCLQY